MGLDNATVKEFANLINPFDKTSGEATVYGRVVGFNEIGGRPIVQLDGSSQRIPIRTTVKVKGPKGSQGDQDYYAGDRVLVRIKNHEALIVSNISTQMTTAEGAEDAAKQYVSDNGFIYAEKISGEQGDFYTLSADKFSATQITGALGHFITVNADRIITDAINAQIANIDTIKASDVVAGEGDFAYLNVDNVLDAKMANLDIANINRASVNSLFVEGFAIASDATIVNGHITGYLDSVEVNANKITAGTLLVDRLYIKNQSTNNKWKMLTVDDQGQIAYVEAADRINERTITADKLVARSITTDELDTTNITANQSSFMESLTNSLTTNYLFATQANVQDLVAHSVDAELAELDILNINEELKTQNIHLGEIVFDQPSKPDVMSGNPDYLLGIERETKTISAYDSTTLYSEGDYVTHYYSKDNLLDYPYYHTTRTYNGITYTDNGDGSITCNGTATANTRFYYKQTSDNWNKLEKGKEYIISIDEATSSTNIRGLEIALYKENTYVYKVWYVSSTKDRKITIPSDVDFDRATAYISIGNGVTVNNLTFKPKIRLATNEDATWYPFVKGVYKCITAISTAELWDENKWYYLRDAVSGDQYEFDHVRYTDFGSFRIDNPTMLFTDPTFKTGVNGTHVYNNEGGSAVALNRVTRSSDNPTDSGYEMQITKAAANVSMSSPGFGGFYWSHQSASGKLYRYKIIAKFPSSVNGQRIVIRFATNAIGSLPSTEWLTPTEGTGKFEEYECQVYCFGSGSYSTTGFFYLTTLEEGERDYYDAFEWRVAYATGFDILSGNIIKSSNSLLERLYPIGYIWISVSRENPGDILNYGIWALMPSNYVLESKNGNSTEGATYGPSPATSNTRAIPSHALTVSEMPSHSHNGATGTVSANHTHAQYVTARQEGQSGTSGIVRDDYSQDNNCCSFAYAQGTSTGYISANHYHGIPAQGGSGAHGHGSISVAQASIQVFIYRRIR